MRRCLAALLVLLVSVLAGCTLLRLEADLEELGQLGRIDGSVQSEADSDAPILVAAFVLPDSRSGRLTLVSSRALEGSGSYEFLLEPGCYHVAALEDRNRNHAADVGERFTFVQEPFCLSSGEERLDIALRLQETWTGNAPEALHGAVDANRFRTGERVDLSDPRFARAEAERGMWQPLASLEHFPAGLYFLDEYDAARVPVVFVHGMAGTARDFETLIAHLDRDRYQPWVAQYPSGLPLSLVGGRLAEALVELHAFHRFDRACLVAHSMGGLVAREMMRQLPGSFPMRGLVTIASPLAGIQSAAAGVRWSPAVVPSWRDLEPKSNFLRRLYDSPLAEMTPYYLLFAFSPGQSSDGVVEIASQLRREAQEEAEIVRGFPASHTGVLHDADVREVFDRFLDRCSAH